MTLGQRIQELRKRAGLSQEGLGEALGVSRQAVSKWEGDNGIPELDTLIAMSRLFGVPLGELLGVEEPETDGGEASAPAALTEEQMEELLRRYVQENKKHQPEPKPIRWQLPLAAGCLLLVLVIVLFVQLGIMRDNMDGLQRQLNQVQSDISSTGNQINNIYYRIGEEIRQQLEAQANVVDTFEYEVTGIDLEQKTVELKLSATLRSYDKGTVVQFVLDSEAGQAVSGEAVWPEFAANLTVPMHHHVEVRARITGADGTVQEQPLETLYSLTEENFALYAGRLTWPYQISADFPFGMKITTAVSEDNRGIMIRSDHPGLVWPEEGTLVLDFNGEILDRKEVNLVYDSEEQTWYFKSERKEFIFREAGKLTITLAMTDNLGRLQEFVEVWYISRDGLDRLPAEAPVTTVD